MIQELLHNQSFNIGLTLRLLSIVSVALMLQLLSTRLLKKLESRASTHARHWHVVLLRSGRKPLITFVWITALSFTIQSLGAVTAGTLLHTLAQPLRHLGTVAVITWFLIRFLTELEHKLVQEGHHDSDKLDPTIAAASGRLLRLFVALAAVLVVLDTFGLEMSSVLAFGGIGGLAVSFAAKDMLANFFGGLMVYIDKPFKVGDWVRSPDKNIEGTVEDIGWRRTVIRTFEKRPLYVPNSNFNTISIENPSRMRNRRIFETIGLRYQDANKIQEVVSRVKAMLADHPEVDNDATQIVALNELGASSLNFIIYAYTKTTDWTEYHQVKQDVLLKIIDIVDACQAEVAFPTSVMHISNPAALAREEA